MAENTPGEETYVAMVFGSGGLGKGGYYNQMGLKGLQKAQAAFGVPFDYQLTDSDADFEPKLRAFAQARKYALVMTMSFGSSNALGKVALEYPDQHFAAFDAYANCPNVANYGSEPRGVSFLAGAAAAWLSETGVVSALFGTESAGYWQWVASYIAGARFAREGVEVVWEFLEGWSPKPEDGEAAAHRVYDRGADVIMAHLDTGDSGIFAAARDRNKYALGFNGERQLDPDRILFDVTRHLEVCVYDAVKRVVQKRFQPGLNKWGIERGQYGLMYGKPIHPKITSNLLDRIEGLRQEIIAGKYDPLPATQKEIEPFLKK